MKLFRFILFLLLFCAGFSVLNALQPDQASSRWEYFYQLPPQSLDIVFIGNSHSFNAFNPQVVDQILGTKSFVIGTAGENIILSYFELKEALRSQRPRVVVLESYALDLRPEDMIEQAHIYNFLDAGRLTENKIGAIAQILFPDHLAGIFPVFRQRIEFNKPYLYLDNLRTRFLELVNPVMEDDIGARINPGVISSAEYEQVVSIQPPAFLDPPQKNLDYLDKFLSTCDQYNILPFFVAAPILQVPERTYDVYAPLDKRLLPEKYGVDFSDFKKNKFSQLHFVNGDHVNAFGSLIVSTETAVNLSEILGIFPNQEALNYFRTYYFEKFDISQTENEATLTLYPMDPGAPLLYSWTVKKGNTTLLETEYQPDNSVTFFMAEVGTYKIQVQIWNPEGDFVLEGEFLHIVEKE